MLCVSSPGEFEVANEPDEQKGSGFVQGHVCRFHSTRFPSRASYFESERGEDHLAVGTFFCFVDLACYLLVKLFV